MIQQGMWNKITEYIEGSKHDRGKMKGQMDLGEAPQAYKDIDLVMENQKDLVKILVRLTPVIIAKG